VEILTKSTLENYMQENIWSKLGATSTTFHPESYTELPPILDMGLRTSSGSKTVQKVPIILKQPATDCLGGIGLFSTPSDFTKLLSALQGGSPLLSATSVETLFRPQLGDESRSSMPKGLGYQMRQILGIKGVDDTDQADHCLAGTITLKDIPGRRPKDTISWSGLPNLHWVSSNEKWRISTHVDIFG
jgi:CubicO group peptidase (beta-lactamase class C family)